MGICQYRYNPTEQYQRTKPGTAPETCCGAKTFPAQDEPELVPIEPEVVDGQTFYRMAPTGRFVNREQDDPWCPLHGGSPAPPPQVITLNELHSARALYGELLARFQATGSLPPGVEPSTWEQIQQAGAALMAADGAPEPVPVPALPPTPPVVPPPTVRKPA